MSENFQPLDPPSGTIGGYRMGMCVVFFCFIDDCYLSEMHANAGLRDPRLMVMNVNQKTQKAPANYIYNKWSVSCC